MSALKNSFKEIIEDNYSGSNTITLKIVGFLNKFIDNKSKLLPYTESFKTQFIDFNSTYNFLLEAEKRIKNDDIPGLREYLKNYKTTNDSKYAAIYRKCLPLLKNKSKLITISNSKTILEILKLFEKDKNKFSVTVCESRPVFEGRIFANELLKCNIEVNFITEAMIAAYVPTVNVALIGADKILKNGNVINKMGSKILAIACKEFDKPFYVAADSSKFSSNNKFRNPRKNPDEIWGKSIKRIQIKNQYLEEIEKKYITKIIRF